MSVHTYTYIHTYIHTYIQPDAAEELRTLGENAARMGNSTQTQTQTQNDTQTQTQTQAPSVKETPAEELGDALYVTNSTQK